MRYSFHGLLTFSIVLLTTFLSNAQKHTKQKFISNLDNWYEGNVIQQDTTLTGLIRHNDIEGSIMFKEDMGATEIQTFGASDVNGYTFFDEKENRKRTYTTLSFDVRENGLPVPTFFEVLKEYEHFALLMAVFPLQTIQKSNPALVYNPAAGTRKVLQRKEVIYIFDDEGRQRQYLEMVSQEGKDIFSHVKNKQHYLESDLLEEYTGDTFSLLKEYAKKNDLNFKKKSDLLKILDYYDMIRP